MRSPQCLHTRGDEITNTAPSFRMRDTTRGNSRSTPRPHRTSYFPFAARTEIFFIRLLPWQFSLHASSATKNVTQMANRQEAQRGQRQYD
jgi:hypothetical protein